LLAGWNYQWFGLSEAGSLYPVPADEEAYDANFVALPAERSEEFQKLLART
jgi:hypothetical protein